MQPQVVQLQIDRVIGLSPPNAGTVAYCPINTDVLCYPAGSFAVVFSSSSKQQLRLLRSTTSNAALSCVAWSGSGEHIAAGEAGPNPSISIWDWSSSKCIHELKGHKQSIASARFSPDGAALSVWLLSLLKRMRQPADCLLARFVWQASYFFQQVERTMASCACGEYCGAYAKPQQLQQQLWCIVTCPANITANARATAAWLCCQWLPS